MRVRMLAVVTGTRDGADWPAVGDVVDVPDAEADSLIAAGIAEAAPAPAPTKGK